MMVRFGIPALALSTAIACVPQATPDEQSIYAENILRAQIAPSQNRVVVATSTYLVEPNSTRTLAMVTPIAGLQHNIDRMEAAAAQFTGCSAKAQPQVYDLMRGSVINSIPEVRIRRFGGRFPIDLSC